MKKICLSLCLILCALMMISCDKDKVNYRVATDNLEIQEGESVTVEYTINPSGVLDAPTLTLVSETVEGTIQISGKKITGLKVGVATIELSVTNLAGASETFSAKTTFTVTVLEKAVIATDDVIQNGSFENSFDSWILIPTDSTYTYKTDVAGDVAHDGDAAFNLWYNPTGEGTGYAVNLTATQTVTMKEDKYVLSFWFKGSVTSITATLLQNEEEVKTETFAGYGYVPAAEDGYVNYGFEFDATAGEYVVQFKIIGEVGSWGYIDLVTLKPGTIEDIVVPNTTPEEGEYNFLTAVSVEETKNGAEDSTVAAAKINVWSKDTVDYTAEYHLTGLPERVYGYCIYVNGTDLGLDVCQIYVKVAGEIVSELTVMPIGWNNGIYERFEIANLNLSGDVTIGIKVTEADAGDNWVNFDKITLYSVGYERPLSSDTSLTTVKVCGVEAIETSVTLTEALYTSLCESTSLGELVTGTVGEGATIKSLVLDKENNELSIEVEAEDGTVQTYLYTIVVSSTKVWQDLTLVNPSFDLVDVWTAEGWDLVGTTDEWIVSGSDCNDGIGCVNLWGKLTVETICTLTQTVAGFTAGETVKLGFYLNSANNNAEISVIIGAHVEQVTFETEWAYTYVEVEYILTEADVVEGAIIVGVQINPLIENATVKLDSFVMKVYR